MANNYSLSAIIPATSLTYRDVDYHSLFMMIKSCAVPNPSPSLFSPCLSLTQERQPERPEQLWRRSDHSIDEFAIHQNS